MEHIRDIVQLADLDKNKKSWTLIIRVTRMWPCISYDKEASEGFNLIVLDSQNFHVHAFIQSDIWKSLKTVIRRGHTYRISDFKIASPNVGHRPVSSNVRIVFTELTTVTSIDESVTRIPLYKFEIVDYADIHKITKPLVFGEYAKFAHDFVGAVVDLNDPVILPSNYGDDTVVHFRITDGSIYLNVTFWGYHIPEVDQLYKLRGSPPPVVILASMRPYYKDDLIQLGTTQASQIFVNIDYPAVANMRNRLIDNGFSVSQ